MTATATVTTTATAVSLSPPAVMAPGGDSAATFVPGGWDDYYMPEVVAPSPQRYVLVLVLFLVLLTSCPAMWAAPCTVPQHPHPLSALSRPASGLSCVSPPTCVRRACFTSNRIDSSTSRSIHPSYRTRHPGGQASLLALGPWSQQLSPHLQYMPVFTQRRIQVWGYTC